MFISLIPIAMISQIQRPFGTIKKGWRQSYVGTTPNLEMQSEDRKGCFASMKNWSVPLVSGGENVKLMGDEEHFVVRIW